VIPTCMNNQWNSDQQELWNMQQFAEIIGL
jgi:hypothetical protein